MQSKKKTKKKVTKKNAAPKTELVKATALVAKLKKSKMPKTVIAKRLGYKSHNTVTNWFKTKSLPSHLVNKIAKMAGV